MEALVSETATAEREDLAEKASVGDHSLNADRSVVGADDELITNCPEFVFPEDQTLVSEADDADNVSAAFLEGARLRVDRRNTEAATNTDDLLGVADRARDTHRTDQRVERGADFAFFLHLSGRFTDCLDYQRDRSFVAVEVGNGQRYPLTVFVEHDDHELPRFCRLGHQRVVNFEQVGDIGKIFSSHNFEI